MNGPEGKTPRRKKRKWLKRLLVAGALVCAAAAVSPFLFTKALVRYLIARSPYRDVPLKFSSASLSPAGRATLHDVVITDTQESAGKPLIAAGSVRLDFGWRDLWHSHVRMIAVEDAQITLRPGKDTSLTLLRLVNPEAVPTNLAAQPPVSAPTQQVDIPPQTQQMVTTTVPAVAPPAAALDSVDATQPVPPASSAPAVASPAPASPDGGFQLDQLLIVGHVRLEGFETWTSAIPLRSQEPIAFQLAMTTRAGPTYTVSVTAGDPDSVTRPGLKARLAVRNTATSTIIAAEQLTLQNLQPVIPEAALSQITILPAEYRTRVAVPPGHIEQIILSGSATISKDTAINLAVDIRNASQHVQQSGDMPAASVENLNAFTHITGKLTDNPLRDLAFANTRCSWDVAQAGEYRFEHGVADLEIAGTDIVLKDLQTTLFDTPLALSGAWDTKAHLLSRGRLWFNNFSAPLILSRLPQSLRRQIPGAIDGTISARVFLTESDAEHIAAHVELACDEQLRYFVNTAPHSTAATQPIHPEALPDLLFLKSELSGTISWNYHADSLPEVSHGRFTSDLLTIASPNPDQGLEINAIKSDFTLGSGILRVIDCYADLAGDGQLSARATYALASGSFEQATLSLQDAESSMFDPWLPGLLRGKFMATLEGKGTPQKAEASLTLELSPDAAFDVKTSMPASVAIGGTGSPTLAVKAFFDRTAATLRFEDLTLRNAGTLHADAGFVAWLSRRIAGDTSELQDALDVAKKGATLSPGDVAFDGTVGWGSAGQINGSLNLSGLDVMLQPETGPAYSLVKLAGKGDFALPWGIASAEQVSINHVELRAASVHLGDREVGDLALEGKTKAGRTSIDLLTATFDEGKFSGELQLATQGTETIHLTFQDINQRLLTKQLYPDVFTAEGPVSGSLTLSRVNGEPFTGAIDLAADKAGRLLISREASGSTIAPVAKAAANNQGGAILPDNFDKIVSDQLADFPYENSNILLQDEDGHLRVTLNIDRKPLKPGDPGYAVPVTVAGQKILANLEFNFQETTITNNMTITDILSQLAAFQQRLQRNNP